MYNVKVYIWNLTYPFIVSVIDYVVILYSYL